MEKKIFINGKIYYLFDEYGNGETAYNTAKHFKKQEKAKYFILKAERGTILPEPVWGVYFNKKLRIL